MGYEYRVWFGYSYDAALLCDRGSLTLLSVFVPADKTEILYEVLIFLRIYLAGISFSIFCFYHKNPKQATFMGTLIYIFAGWTIYAAMKHPYFSNL